MIKKVKSRVRKLKPKKTGGRLPTSGSEHTFTMRGWSHPIIVGHNNCYAYAVHDMKLYRSNKSVPGERTGAKAPINYRYKTCGNLGSRVVSDNPKNVYKCTANERCKMGFYKIMMFVAPENDRGDNHGDFHFYKQHSKIEYKINKKNKPVDVAAFFDVSSSVIRQAARRAYLKKKNSIKNPTMVDYWLPGLRIIFKANAWSHKQGWATTPLLIDAKGKPIRDPRKADRNYSMKYKTYCNSFCVRNKGIKVGNRETNVLKNRIKMT